MKSSRQSLPIELVSKKGGVEKENFTNIIKTIFHEI